jgi:hypothetical protein
MNQSEPTKQDLPGSEERQPVRKPYQKPEVRHERVFETMALSCGKVGSTQAACHFVRKTS